MFASVNCGSGTSASLNTAKDTNREFGRSSPVIEVVGAATPSPYLADNSRAYLLLQKNVIRLGFTFIQNHFDYLEFATPHAVFFKLLQEPSNDRYFDLRHTAGAPPHVVGGGSLRCTGFMGAKSCWAYGTNPLYIRSNI